MSFDCRLRQSAYIPQISAEKFELAFGRRYSFRRPIGKELSLAEEALNRANSTRHTRFSLAEVIVGRIQLRPVQADRDLVAALEPSNQFIDPLNVIADGGNGVALILKPPQQIAQNRPEDRKSSNAKTSAWT